MKYELEILDEDLLDRAKIINMRVMIENEIKKLSEFSKNNLPNQIENLRSALEQMENGWLFWQREKTINLLSAALNVDRSKMGERVWREVYDS